MLAAPDQLGHNRVGAGTAAMDAAPGGTARNRIVIAGIGAAQLDGTGRPASAVVKFVAVYVVGEENLPGRNDRLTARRSGCRR